MARKLPFRTTLGAHRLATACVLFLLLAPAFAQEPSNRVESSTQPYQVQQAYTLPNTEVRSITSSTGEEYRIYLAWPEHEAPESGHPVTYLLDGDTSFALFTSIHRRFTASERALQALKTSPGIVVAIGYPDETRRTHDYTPPAPEGGPPPLPNGNPWPHGNGGGADAFLDFLLHDLKPVIEKDYPVDPNRQSLMGHSFGALFTLHAMFRQPDAFQHYIAMSPSLWWNPELMREAETRFVERIASGEITPPRQLLLTVGEYEQRPRPPADGTSPAPATGPLESRRMIDNSRDLAERLSGLKAQGLTVSHRMFEQENHGSVVPAAMSHAMPFAYPAVVEE